MSTSTRLLTTAHAATAVRFLRQGLPPSAIDNDQARLVIGFYCLATLDLLRSLDTAITPTEREEWRKWVWEQQISGSWGVGFRGSPYTNQPGPSEHDPPFLIMTYAALLSLAILRDPFTKLDKPGVLEYVRSSQRDDGSFRLHPSSEEYDLRMTYCAFAICALLDDWTPIRLPSALAFIQSCRSYEGGYGQESKNEAHGGSTYCALAALALVPLHAIPSSFSSSSSSPTAPTSSLELLLTPFERRQTLRWLLYQQQYEQKESWEGGEVFESGFSGRTNKVPDACYCFWCGAAIAILGHPELVNAPANARFLLECQFKFGGIRKDREAFPDPYHTYLGLASLCILSKNESIPPFPDDLDPRWNATSTTKGWIENHLHRPKE